MLGLTRCASPELAPGWLSGCLARLFSEPRHSEGNDRANDCLGGAPLARSSARPNGLLVDRGRLDNTDNGASFLCRWQRSIGRAQLSLLGSGLVGAANLLPGCRVEKIGVPQIA